MLNQALELLRGTLPREYDSWDQVPAEYRDIPEDSMSRTPSAIEGQGGAITEKQSRERGRMLQVRDQMAQLAAENGLKVSDGIANSLLPTPVVVQGRNATSGRQPDSHHHTGQTLHDLVFDGTLLPTVKARDSNPEGYEAG